MADVPRTRVSQVVRAKRMVCITLRTANISILVLTPNIDKETLDCHQIQAEAHPPRQAS